MGYAIFTLDASGRDYRQGLPPGWRRIAVYRSREQCRRHLARERLQGAEIVHYAEQAAFVSRLWDGHLQEASQCSATA